LLQIGPIASRHQILTFYMRSFVFVVLLLVSGLYLSAQSSNSIKLTGKVLDQITQRPVEYATITLTDASSGKTLNGAVAGKDGSFIITGLSAGRFKLLVDFIGYSSFLQDSLEINPQDQTINIGTLNISPRSQTLQGVTVTGKAPIVENKIDKLIYNAVNDITSQGGAAIDVLRKVPQVNVDIDGNVELQGNSNIRFLINGKPSSIFGNSLADALASLPASQIKSIEVITSPGAKYDAQGTGGIINIILKDNRLQGMNGTANLSLGTRLENGSLNLNVRHNNFGINGYLNGNRQLRSRTPSEQQRISTDNAANTTTQLMQNGTTNFERNGYQAGLGFDWTITRKDIITGSIGYSQFSSQNKGLTAQDQATQDLSGGPISNLSTTRDAFSPSKSNSWDGQINYKRKMAKDGQELDISVNTSIGQPNSYYTQYQTYKGQTNPYAGLSSHNPGKDNETEMTIDYAHPVNDNFLIETGAKAIYQHINSDIQMSKFDPAVNDYVFDPAQSYRLNYTMHIYGAYLSSSFSLTDWLDVKAGMRYEHTTVGIDFPNTSIPSYGTWVPSIIFSHKAGEDQSFKLAYSHRIERPEYRELNPFLNVSDPYNISTGNPLMKPEIGDNMEFGYNRSFAGGANIYAALTERINSHDIKQITTFYPSFQVGDSLYSNVSVISPQNIGTEYNSGLMVSGSVPVKEKLNLRGNLQLTHRYIRSEQSFGNISMGFRFRLNLNASYQLPKNLILELFGNYNAPSNNVQGKLPQSFTYTFAFRKQIWNKKASFGFTATNPFNQYINQLSTIDGDNYTSYALRKVPYRSFGISLMVKFGKLEFKKPKEQDNSDMNNPPVMGN
jgi:ferric enterobactin receptor